MSAENPLPQEQQVNKSGQLNPILTYQTTRRGLLFGAGIISLSAALSACSEGSQPNPTSTKSPSTPVKTEVRPTLAPLPVRTLDNELAELRAKGAGTPEQQQLENSIWTREPFMPAHIGTLTTQEADAIGRQKLAFLIDQMSRSQNIHFSATATTIKDMVANGQLYFNTSLEVARGITLMVRPGVSRDGRSYSYITSFLNQLTDVTDQQMAVRMVHEMSHVEDYKFQAATLAAQGKTPQEALTIMVNSAVNCTDTESKAHAKDVKAYAYARALDPTFIDRDQEIKAADFFKWGGTETSPEWRNRIGRLHQCAA